MEKLRLNFTGAAPTDGIALVAEDLRIEPAEDGMPVEVKECEKHFAGVTVSDGRAVITYGGGRARFFRALGRLCEGLAAGKRGFSFAETPSFDTNGAMFDMSRNSVLNVNTVKMLLRRHALMGLNTFMLYTEDTYEVQGQPYFGHMRGRYTKEEIRELDAYAILLGVELVPCIQLLAHLAPLLKWDAYARYRDTHDVIIADDDETDKLIDRIFASVSDMFTSRRIHIGMDEAMFLGQGSREIRYGPSDRTELFCRHLNRIVKLAEPYGFRMMMWSDMFFHMAGGSYRKAAGMTFGDKVLKAVPHQVQQVFWAYDAADDETVDANVRLHRQLSDSPLFAGGIWTWRGYAPHYRQSLGNIRTMLLRCREDGIREVFATVWHNGAECSLLTSLYGIQLYAEIDYTGVMDEEAAKARFAYLCRADAEDILAMEDCDNPDERDYGKGEKNIANATRWLVYNDPLLGLLDWHVQGTDTGAFYRRKSAEFASVHAEDPWLEGAFGQFRAVLSLLELKADFGVRLKAAYDAADREALRALSDESLEISARLTALKEAHRASWMQCNKPFGFEMFDLIYGGLKERMETVRSRIAAYLGSGEPIAELAEERLPFVARPDDASRFADIGPRFGRLFTPAVYATVFNNSFIG